MPSTLQVPCVRCGRSVTVAAPRPLPTCAICAGGAASWDVRVGGERLTMDRATIRARLLDGTLSGADVVQEGVNVTPIAGHEAFRTWFLPGHADALPQRAAPAPGPAAAGAAPASGAFRRIAGLLGLGVGLIAIVAGAVSLAPALRGSGVPAKGELDAAAIAGAAVSAPVALPPAAPVPVQAPPVVDPIGALVARVGAVDEPRAALLVAAWESRLLATPEGAAAALTAAERAVARTPEDPEALSLLAELLAEKGESPELRTALLARATGAAPGAPAIQRAVALDALARGEVSVARGAVDACLRVAVADLGCREASGRVAEALAPALKESEAANLLYGLDELARAWPENTDLRRRAALLAARAEVLGAEDRLEVERKRLPGDVDLLAADALLAFRNGSPKRARALLAKVPNPPEPLLVEAAGEAVGRGAAQEALDLLVRLKGASSGREGRLYEAQARWILLREGKGTAAAATAAGERVAALDAGSPAVIQVRVGVAALANDAAAVAKAWGPLQLRGAPPVDLAQAWLARAAMDVAQEHPREALIEVESALQADRSTPEVHLWQAAAQAAAQNGPAAAMALRGAIVAIDGRHARRRSYGGALPLRADLPAIRSGVVGLLGTDPARKDDLLLAVSVLDWLGGDLAGALATVGPLAERGSDADALALEARLLLATGQPDRAIARLDQALALRPKEVAWHLARAEALFGAGRLKEAEAALTLARSGAAPASSLQLLAARVAAKKGDTAAALVARRAAVAADPTDLVARRALRGVSED